jgi:hypothetical protein
MPAHPSVASFNGAIYAITSALPATYDAAGYGATTLTYTTIGKVESFPEFGLDQTFVDFVPVNGDVEYTKSPKRYGSGPMVMADVPADAGQVLLKALAATADGHYSMKITYTDGEIHYLDVQAAGWKLSGSAGGGQMKRTTTLALCKTPVVVAAA